MNGLQNRYDPVTEKEREKKESSSDESSMSYQNITYNCV